MAKVIEYVIAVKATQTIYRAGPVMVKVVAHSQEAAEEAALCAAKKAARRTTDLMDLSRGCENYDVETNIQITGIDPHSYDEPGVDVTATSATDYRNAEQKAAAEAMAKLEAAGQARLL